MTFQRYRTVSFDIFDTLLSRRLGCPRDLFSLMQAAIAEDPRFLPCETLIDSFSELRILAEQQARDAKVASGSEAEILIGDIYDQLHQLVPQLTSALCETLIALEIDQEKCVLFKNPRGEQHFNQARAAGCQLVVISDMYLPAETLRELLTHCGYATKGIPLYSSGEVGLSKHSGALYPHVQQTLGLDPTSWLHVGDNHHADIENARSFKISTLHADWSDYHHQRSLHWTAREIIGESICHNLQSTQVKPYYQQDALTEIGFTVFGPLLLGYISWLVRELRDRQIDKVLFLARDAHLIEKIYNRYFTNSAITNEYIYLSRASTYLMGLTDWPMHRIWHLFGGKNRKSVAKILAMVGLESHEYLSEIHDVGFPDEHYVPQHDEASRVHWLINRLFRKVLLRNTEAREQFSGYFKQACEGHQHIALVDVGWMGNIQSVFARALGAEWADKQIEGLYLATLEGARDNRSGENRMAGWLANYGLPADRNQQLLSGGVELLEFAMADNTGSTLGYIRDAQGIHPVRDETSNAEQHYLQQAATLQQGILSFFDYIQPMLAAAPATAFSSTRLAEPFFQLINAPSSRQLAALASLTHAEAAGSNAQRLPLAEKLPLFSRLFPRSAWAEGLEKSYWKEGFRRLNRRKFWARYP